MTKGIFRSAVLAAAALMLAPMSGAKAAWPEKPIKIVLPFGAGGVADVTSRIMADKLGQKLGQRVVIENMPGPGGINAARAVITAPPDGYTMALVTNGTAISAYVPANDSGLADFGSFSGVYSSLRWTTKVTTVVRPKSSELIAISRRADSGRNTAGSM